MGDFFRGFIPKNALEDKLLLDAFAITKMQRLEDKDSKEVDYLVHVRFYKDSVDELCNKLINHFKSGFFCFFENDNIIAVVFKGKYFVVDKTNEQQLNELKEYAESQNLKKFPADFTEMFK